MNWWQRLFNKGNNYQTQFDEQFSFVDFLDSAPRFNDYCSAKEKIEAVLKNPALLKVFTLQCDLFSLGKIYAKQDGEIIDNDPLVKLLKNPNPLQSQSQFLWDFMFWNMLGTSYCYVDSYIPGNDNNKLYFLDESKMEFPKELEKLKDKLIFSNSTITDAGKLTIKYKYADGTYINLPLSKINIVTDLTNGTGNWFKGNSRIDALYKIISNSEETLNATNINTRFTGKFLVAGTQDPNDVTKTPMSQEEKVSIEQKVNSNKQIHAVKSAVDIKRFIENMRNLELGKSYLESYYLIGSMYNIPKDVLEAHAAGATYENQEKSTAKHISYTLQPKGNDFLQSLVKKFGYEDQGISLEIDWSHLPFMNVFEKDKAATRQTQVITLTNLLKLGVDINEANDYLGTNFTIAVYEQPKVNTGANQGN